MLFFSKLRAHVTLSRCPSDSSGQQRTDLLSGSDRFPCRCVAL